MPSPDAPTTNLFMYCRKQIKILNIFNSTLFNTYILFKFIQCLRDNLQAVYLYSSPLSLTRTDLGSTDL